MSNAETYQNLEAGGAEPSTICETISVVSGKGGTGKSLIAACLAYALQNAGLRVCLVDTDFATQGLSLFLLGPAAELGTSRGLTEENSLFHMVSQWKSEKGQRLPKPARADRIAEEDHGTSYNLIVSNTQFYDRRLSLGVPAERREAEDLLSMSMGETTDIFRSSYREFFPLLFDQLKQSGEYDYVIVDTRGGFGELSLVPAVFSDSFLVVTEPDFTSLHQMAKLMTNIDLMALSEERYPYLRGVIVNKAVDGEEEGFRAALESQFGIEFQQSWAIPLDTETVRVSKDQLIPYREAPESPFSKATLNSMTDIFDLVTVDWSQHNKLAWHSLVDTVNQANREREDTERHTAQSVQEADRTVEALRNTLSDTTSRVEHAEERSVELESQLEDARDRLSYASVLSRAERAEEQLSTASRQLEEIKNQALTLQDRVEVSSDLNRELEIGSLRTNSQLRLVLGIVATVLAVSIVLLTLFQFRFLF